MRLLLKVVPKASRDRIVGWLGDRLKVSVTAAPERGRANGAVEALLARALDVPSSRVRIVAGGASSLKTVLIDGLDEAAALSKLPGRRN